MSEHTRLSLEEYAPLAARTCANLGLGFLDHKLNDHLADNLHMTMGMVTEVGELVDVFKKNLAYGKPIDWVNVGEEIADVMWYISNFCRINNIDLERELAKNINKLQVRYPDKFSQDAAINRNLEAERTELEKP